MSSEGVPGQPYHHGDLRNALIQAALDLAREGGPEAVVLREAARRVGVSPTAAYRHFTALPELVEAVTIGCLGELARAMEAELAKGAGRGGPDGAWERLCAIGRGYVQFAVTEPGLFATAFAAKEQLVGDTGALGMSAYGLLGWALDALVEAGSIAPVDLEAAAINAWATVHGLSLLLLGPLRTLTDAERDGVIESTLDLVGRGLLVRQ